MDKQVTMKDIANAVNISVVSVSKALSGKEGVSNEIRRKIIDKADELGYNYTSKNTEAKSNFTIGIVIPDVFFQENSFYAGLYRMLSLEASKKGVFCIIEIISYANLKNLVLPNIITSKKVDGIIFVGETDDRYIYNVIKRGIPYMLLDFYDTQNKCDAVLSDGIGGAYQLTQKLIENGFTDIGFVGNIVATTSIMDRYLGYYKALMTNKIKVKFDRLISDRDNMGKICDFILPEIMPEAFVCNCDETAYKLISQLNTLGYKVPDDISVVGFDNSRFATLCNPQLTTYYVNMEKMAEVAVTQLIAKINSKSFVSGAITIKGNIIERNSIKSKS